MGSLARGVGSAINSLLGGITGQQQTIAASKRAAQQQREAAVASVFRPVGMTTRFGTSQFGYENIGGIPRVTSAGYQISPELRAIQDALMGLTSERLMPAMQAGAAAQQIGMGGSSLFGLGQQYIAESPELARQQYFNQQMALLQPARQAEEQRLASSVFGRGRAGLNIAGSQPELGALAGARAMQELQLAAQAEQAAQQRQQFGAGLMGQGVGLFSQQYALPTQALAPIQGLLGAVGTIEELGQQPFTLGLQVGSAGQPGATSAAGLLSQAAQTQYQGVQQANLANAQLLSGIIQGAGSAFGGGK